MLTTVIFDGDCSFCSSAARFAQKYVAPKLNYQPYQQTDLAEFNLALTECEAALQLVTNSGEKFSAERAVLKLLKSGNLFARTVGLALQFPGFKPILKFGYAKVAKNRHRLPGGRPECSL